MHDHTQLILDQIVEKYGINHEYLLAECPLQIHNACMYAPECAEFFTRYVNSVIDAILYQCCKTSMKLTQEMQFDLNLLAEVIDEVNTPGEITLF